MDKPFSKTETLSIADFGHSVFEITHKPVFGHPVFGDYVGLKALGWRSPRSILYWRLNPSDGNIDHIHQLITGDLGRYVDIPGEFLLVASLEKEGDLYEGVSLLRSCYGAWKRKNLYLELMAIGNERNAIPTPTAEIPDGKHNSLEFNNLISALQNYTSHENAYFTYPAGWKISFLNSNFDPEKLKQAIDFEDSQIVAAFMANFLLLGSTQSGSRAVSADQSEFFLGSIQWLADEAVKPHNHKLIPNLVKMKFGPQEGYPRIKISGIADKGGIELADALNKYATAQYIQPDDRLEEHLRKRYGLPAKSDKGVRIVQAPKGMQQGDNVVTTDHPDSVIEKEKNIQGSEERLTLASAKVLKRARVAKAHFPLAKKTLKALMQKELCGIATQMVTDIMRAKKKLPAPQKRKATANVAPSGALAYRSLVEEALTDTAIEALGKARSEVPKKKNVRLIEEIRTFTLSGPKKLPPAVVAKIAEQAGLIVDTQMNDLEKILFFQFGHSVDSTDDDKVLTKDLQDAGDGYVASNAPALAASNATSSVINEARNSFFFDPEVLPEIEAMQFVNGDPQCPLCQDLSGQTFDTDDAEAKRYFPPLHHNCDCILVPVLSGENADVTGLKPSKSSLDDYMTFSEKKTQRDLCFKEMLTQRN